MKCWAPDIAADLNPTVPEYAKPMTGKKRTKDGAWILHWRLVLYLRSGDLQQLGNVRHREICRDFSVVPQDSFMSALPALTHLRICGGDSQYGVLGDETVLAIDTFLQHLHTLDRMANGARIEPIDAYLQLVGLKIESLSLEYWVDGDHATDAFEQHAMALATNLIHLSCARQDPRSLPTTFTFLSSVQLATISIEVCPIQGDSECANWLAIDKALAVPQFATLQRVLFTDQLYRKSIVTAWVKVLMPQARACAILD
ncbi:hypothetical protein C8R44DRAFT_733005 [Mycena epipterygia]|nr:hypothetical protein C8R44DRAFT_733005 [Mycena epipterygia]